MEVEITLRADAAAAPSLVDGKQDLADFQLLAALGEGAHGRVYLAQQSSLGDRPVVLKVSSRRGREHLSLARLQHTNIMPLYWVHDEPEADRRTLCMPYLGSLTLAALLATLEKKAVQERSGKDIIDALDKAGVEGAPELTTRGPVRLFFASASYVQAACWLFASLADALHYAHNRGLIHLDLKPSNVLLAADGQPMLLDFHLARDPIKPGDPRVSSIGGTPDYMSPEQRHFIADSRAGNRSGIGIDQRSDLYSLGLIMYRTLAGRPPLDDCQRLDRCNRGVSRGLADIVHKCLAANPEERYQDAGILAADLRRHLGNLPLRGVANRSIAERWHKWRKRKPHAVFFAAAAATLLATIASAGVMVLHSRQQQTQEEIAKLLAIGRQQLAAKDVAAIDSFEQAARRAQPAQAAAIAKELQQAREQLLTHDLQEVVTKIRYAVVDDALSPGDLALLEETCGQLWIARSRFDEIKQRSREDLLDLAIIAANLRAPTTMTNSERHRDALDLLDEAEREFGRSGILYLQRAKHLRAIRRIADADVAERAAKHLPVTGAWQHIALGRAAMHRGGLEEAIDHFDRAIVQAPSVFWPYFYEGLCRFRCKEYSAAAEAFRTCIALDPASAPAWYNRALALARMHQFEKAAQARQRLREVDPHFNPTLLHNLADLIGND